MWTALSLLGLHDAYIGILVRHTHEYELAVANLGPQPSFRLPEVPGNFRAAFLALRREISASRK